MIQDNTICHLVNNKLTQRMPKPLDIAAALRLGELIHEASLTNFACFAFTGRLSGCSSLV